VVHYHLQRHQPHHNTALARDTVYGLFTVIFLFLSLHTFESSSRHIDCPPLLSQMQEETRLHIVREAQLSTKPEGIAPSVTSILEAIKLDPTRPLTPQTTTSLNSLPADERATYLDNLMEYLEELRQRYDGLQSVNLAREF
jgi:hypothetical protein